MKIQDNVSSPSNGVAFTVSGIRFLGVSITGTATTFQVDFYATINDIDYFPIAGRKVDDPDFNFVSSTIEKNKFFLFDVTAFARFQARITSVSGGSLTIETSEER